MSSYELRMKKLVTPENVSKFGNYGKK